MAAHICVFIWFDHYPANHRTSQQGNIPVAVQQGNETCQEYIKKAASKIALKYDIDGDGKDEGSVTCDLDSILLLKEENSEIKGNKILIFDDLERCDVKLETLLGYINYFSEHCKCKVIIIGDENKISEKRTISAS